MLLLLPDTLRNFTTGFICDMCLACIHFPCITETNWRIEFHQFMVSYKMLFTKLGSGCLPADDLINCRDSHHPTSSSPCEDPQKASLGAKEKNRVSLAQRVCCPITRVLSLITNHLSICLECQMPKASSAPTTGRWSGFHGVILIWGFLGGLVLGFFCFVFCLF